LEILLDSLIIGIHKGGFDISWCGGGGGRVVVVGLVWDHERPFAMELRNCGEGLTFF